MRRRDLRVLQALYGDAELMHFITGRARTPWETRARLKKDLGYHRTHGFGLCIVEWKDTGQPIGRAGLEPVVGPMRVEGELAWMFSQPWWGKGLASEAGAALLNYGLDDLGLSRVFAESHPDNHASIRVMEKIGMTRTESVDGRVIYEVRRDPGVPDSSG